MRVFRSFLLSAFAGALSVSPAGAGNVFVQVQCGNPPEIAETSHSVTLEGSFSSDSSSSRWLVPLAGQIDALRIDATSFTVTTGEIDGGFLQTNELGRIFLTVSEETPGYRAVVMDSQIEQIERAGE